MRRTGPYYRWTAEQDRLLTTLAGTMPASTVLRRVNEAGPRRVLSALKDRAKRRGIDLRPNGALLTTREPGEPRPEWTKPEEQAIREMAGKLPVGDIVARLNERFLTRRTESAVKNRAGHLGVSLSVRGRYLTVIAVARALRVGHERVSGWIDGGLLQAERPGGPSRGSVWLIEPPEHLAFDETEVHIPIGTSLEESERQMMLKTFAFTAGDHRKTARILGVTQKVLKEKLQKFMTETVPAG